MKDNMKRVYKFVLLIILLLSLTACGTVYEDTNGADNYELQTITDENIVKMDVGATNFSYRETNLPFGISSAEYYSENFNGVYEIYLTNYLFASTVEIYVGHMEVTEGNFRLAVINDDEIIFDIPLDSFGETYRFDDITGTFAIRAAGESASFEFYLDIY